MFTTGFKFHFGAGTALALAAVVYGYSSGGGGLGPLVLGWKGGVGDHLGYGLLVAAALAFWAIGLVLVAVRDADPEVQAAALGADTVPVAPPVTGTAWPVVGAFGAATTVVGLVLGSPIFVLGLAIGAVTLIEWTMDAWADRATGDPAANRELRNRLMAPVEVPVVGALVIAVAVLSVSRILLAVSELGAVVIAGVIAVVILGATTLYAAVPRHGRTIVTALGLLLAVALLAGGIIAAVHGERDFEHHGHEGAMLVIGGAGRA
ncbi:MAG: hypothetical protein D6683_10095 [Actinomyces sp.]|nr:MAG: hypothetical protein D6683_10095 [Actinomyces sp.]